MNTIAYFELLDKLHQAKTAPFADLNEETPGAISLIIDVVSTLVERVALIDE